MTTFINGSLYVDVYTPTGNPGEYTFENGIYSNINDSGNGAYDLLPGFLVYIQPTNINLGTLIPGISNRYVLTTVTVIDQNTISGTILWNNKGDEDGVPSNGVYSIISQSSSNLKLVLPPVDNNYPNLTPGSTLAAMINDLSNIMDTMTSNGQSVNNVTEVLPLTSNGQKEFTLRFAPVNKENTTLTVNGLKYAYGVSNDFTIDGTLLTWTEQSLVLELIDTVTVSYMY